MIYTVKNMDSKFAFPRRLKLYLKDNTFRKAKSIEPNSSDCIYIVNQWYWSGYWQKPYKVLKKEFYYDKRTNKKKFKNVTVLWIDGTKSTHCTSLDPRRDYKLYK